VVTSEVNGKKLKFNAKDPGAILSVPTKDFDVYVRDDKTVFGTVRLLQLTQTLSQQTRLKAPQSVTKDAMDQCLLTLWIEESKLTPQQS